MTDRLVNWFQFMVANPWMDGNEFTKNIATAKKLVIEEWLASMGVLCDCDDGWRQFPPPGGAEKCDRCTLVEVGGIRVRAIFLIGSTVYFHGGGAMLLPAVEVTE